MGVRKSLWVCICSSSKLDVSQENSIPLLNYALNGHEIPGVLSLSYSTNKKFLSSVFIVCESRLRD